MTRLPEDKLPFTRAEYAARLAKVRAEMQRRGIALLIISDPSNMAWLSGYDGWSFYVHQAVLVTDSGEPWWFGRLQDANGARRTVYMQHANILSYADHYVQSSERHPMQKLCEWIRQYAWPRECIGVEMDNYYFSAAAYRELQKHLPDARWVDATGLVNWLRGVKSETELDYMRRAGRIVERMHARLREVVKPGVKKCDLAAEIYAAGLRGGGDYPAIAPLMPSGEDAAAPHLTWDESKLQSGEGVFFEIAGCYRRYHCPMSRTFFLGKAPPKFQNAEQAVLEGLHAGLAQARAGNRACDIANAFYATLKKYAIEKHNRTGYAVGLSYPPDWGERSISLRADDMSELKTNMTFHFMTGLWMDDWGVEITETFVIGERGAELLGDVPREIVEVT